MKRRILAWILLIGFVVLIINIYTGFHREISIMVYIAVAAYFLMTNKKPPKEQ